MIRQQLSGRVHRLRLTVKHIRKRGPKRRRKELTRRGFLIGGIAAALGALSIPFWPRGHPVSVQEVLPKLREAQANPGWLKALCLEYCKATYPPDVRRLAIGHMIAFCRSRDERVCAALWERIGNDPVLDNRRLALRILLRAFRDQDVQRLADLYQRDLSARPIIDETLKLVDYPALKSAIGHK